jgi:6-phosphofructokinase 1
MNAALRAVVKAATLRHDIRVTGFLDGFAGLLSDQARPLGFDDVSGILTQGGTILGASNRDDPFRVPVERAGARTYEDRSDSVLETLARRGVEGLVVIGGDGSLTIGRRLQARGVPLVVIPKTIDNDVPGTDVTIGFDTAVGIATDALDRLHTTAASHHRVMVVEVMGRQAGWIALEAGTAAGADAILIPEIAFRYEAVAAGILARVRRGRRFSVVVVAEGARSPGGGPVVRRIIEESPEPVRLGGVGVVVANALEVLVPFEVRYVVLGHVQRGGTPTAFDRVLATRFGTEAVAALADGGRDIMVALRGDRIERAPLGDLPTEPRRVDPRGEHVTASRSVGTVFGDEAPT